MATIVTLLKPYKSLNAGEKAGFDADEAQTICEKGIGFVVGVEAVSENQVVQENVTAVSESQETPKTEEVKSDEGDGDKTPEAPKAETPKPRGGKNSR